MDGLTSCESSSMATPISPKSPPGGLDLYGKRRQMVKVQILEREICFLQEELKSVEGLQPASRCCKELDDFLGAKPDPFITKIQEAHSSASLWKRLWQKFCLDLQRICCFRSSRCNEAKPNCCKCFVSISFHLCECGCLETVTPQKCCKCVGFSCHRRACCCIKSLFHKCYKSCPL